MVSEEVARMPGLVRAATVVLALQFVFGLIGLIFGWMALASVLGTGASGALPVGGLMVVLTATLASQAWLMRRLGGRRRWVRWAVVGLEAFMVITDLTLRALDPGLTVRSFLVALPLPTVVIVLLLLPAAGRWFDRPHGSNNPQ
jgi:hypothetical protein